MKKELDDKLVESFPNLYADRHASMQETCMCWGFPGDGWFDLIFELSKKLELMILLLPEEQRKEMKASQVKEKFGGLRFYMTLYNEEFEALIREAQSKSFHICEECGKPGQLIRAGWLYVSCKEHAKEEHKDQFKDKEEDDGTEES
jgi:hypothetical protein